MVIPVGIEPPLLETVFGEVHRKNFDHMPELGWQYGYAYALVLMGIVAGGLWAFFKKSGWL